MVAAAGEREKGLLCVCVLSQNGRGCNGATTVDTLWDALIGAKAFLSARVSNTIISFVNLIKSFQLAANTLDAYETAHQVAKETGVLKDLYSDKSIEGLARHENVQELLNAIKEFVDDDTREEHSLAVFLEEVSLLTQADEKDNIED